jgi:hypothetical protein
MKKVFILIPIFFSFLIGCSEKNVAKKTVILQPEGVKILCVYEMSGQYYIDDFKEKRSLLNSIAFYYIEENHKYYLGRIDRQGVFNANGVIIFQLPGYMRGAYVSPRNLVSPKSVNYIYLSGGRYRESDTVFNIEFSIDKKTIREFHFQI